MTRRDRVAWLPLALLLLQVPGCWCLGGPRMVTGSVGRSLNVTCHYEDKYAGHVKYWCRDSCWTSQKKIVETSKSEREGRSGRVSIRDHPANLTFTVTVENLTEADAGTYYCGIDTVLSFNPTFRVEVSVSPAPRRTPSPVVTTSTPGSQGAPSASSSTTEIWRETLGPSQHPGSLLGSVHFLLLVFLKVPLLLGMLSAVLWVHRPQRRLGGRQSQPDYKNQGH
ncbi:protein CD300H-like [Talpa occidentalis]|uniref:protein CD300H-like n=1 Tax=Talpa occidentalis TaxID=50954 RepID=UPI00188E7044|nr:protein CD300H-like [Talpa occidentalis]XP_037349544.1 protein CD300H-like [Talpa occidentalis]